MALQHIPILFLVAVVAGAINSVAGGGSFLAFPALIFAGLPPVNANATNTMALWPGTLASIGAYRRELTGSAKRVLLPLVITGLIGGLFGAIVLLKTPQATFLRLVPYLLGSATVLFAFSGQISSRLRHRVPTHERFHTFGGALLQLVIAVYIGFFGAGAGILMLAMFALMGMENIHTMNAYKTVLGAVCNGIAVIAFIVARAIYWPHALLMLLGASLGGYFGAYFAQKMDPRYVRWAVIVVGAGMSLYFFWKTA